ncbi:putative DNA topoisomerase I [Candidatus Magnetomoraceae bacterium gMMP-15]
MEKNIVQSIKVRKQLDRILSEHVRRLAGTTHEFGAMLFSMDLITLSCIILIVEREKEIELSPSDDSERYTEETLLKTLAEFDLNHKKDVNRNIRNMVQTDYLGISENQTFVPRKIAYKLVQLFDNIFPKMVGRNLMAYFNQATGEVLAGNKDIDSAITQVDQMLHAQGSPLLKAKSRKQSNGVTVDRREFDQILRKHVRRLAGASHNLGTVFLTLDMMMVSCAILFMSREKEVENASSNPPERYTYEKLLKALSDFGLNQEKEMKRTLQDMVQRDYLTIGDNDILIPTELSAELTQLLDNIFPKMPGLNFIAYLSQITEEVLSGSKDSSLALSQLDQTLTAQGLPIFQAEKKSKLKSKADKLKQSITQKKLKSKKLHDPFKAARQKISSLYNRKKTEKPKSKSKKPLGNRVLSASGQWIKLDDQKISSSPAQSEETMQQKSEISEQSKKIDEISKPPTEPDESKKLIESPVISPEEVITESSEEVITESPEKVVAEFEEKTLEPTEDQIFFSESLVEPELTEEAADLPVEPETSQEDMPLPESEVHADKEFALKKISDRDSSKPEIKKIIADAVKKEPVKKASETKEPEDSQKSRKTIAQQDEPDEDFIARQIASMEEELAKKEQNKKAAIQCPFCRKNSIEKKYTGKGKTYYECKTQGCKFISWEKPYNSPCPECGGPFLVETKQNGEIIYKCPKATCSYISRNEGKSSGTSQAPKKKRKKVVRRVLVRRK